MRFTTEDSQLTIRLEGFEQVWALKRQLQIPSDAIEQIDYILQAPATKDLWGYWRFPGTALPGLFLAGTYLRQGEREFWYIHTRQPGLLVISLKPKVCKYDKIRVTCTPEIAQSLADWWHERRA